MWRYETIHKEKEENKVGKRNRQGDRKEEEEKQKRN